MKRTARSLLATSLFALTAALLVQATVACGGTVVGSGGGTGTTTGTGGSSACTLDPPGKTFTFHVLNSTKEKRTLLYGCGQSLPIELETPSGKLGIGPGPANGCEFKCDDVYAGKTGNACSDCGPGVSADVAPAMQVDIAWDRRVYVAHTPDAACDPNKAGGCALGQTVAPQAMQQGVLTLCADASPMGSYCTAAGTITKSFTVDTTQDGATITLP